MAGKLIFRKGRRGRSRRFSVRPSPASSRCLKSATSDGSSRERARIGALLALVEPSRDTRAQAATMGYSKPGYQLRPEDMYDRYQILSIRQLFERARPQFPPFRNVTFQPAPKVNPAKSHTGPTHRLSLPSETGSGPRP
jgi:hypothetical protein